MGKALVRPIDAMAWELRYAWAVGKRVSLSLASGLRIEGHVTTVAATSAFVVVSGCHVPLAQVLAVHNPSRLGDSSVGDEPWNGRARRPRPPQKEELPEFAV
jgi:hypothetical protein